MPTVSVCVCFCGSGGHLFSEQHNIKSDLVCSDNCWCECFSLIQIPTVRLWLAARRCAWGWGGALALCSLKAQTGGKNTGIGPRPQATRFLLHACVCVCEKQRNSQAGYLGENNRFQVRRATILLTLPLNPDTSFHHWAYCGASQHFPTFFV